MLSLEAYQTVTRTHIIVITWRLILGAEWLDKYICVKKTRCKEILNSMTEGMNLPVATCLEFLVIAVRLIRNENFIKRNIFTWRATFFICTGRPVWCKQKLGTWWLLILSFVKLGEKVLFFSDSRHGLLPSMHLCLSPRACSPVWEAQRLENCTAGIPFWTNNGWKRSINFSVGSW